MVWKWHHVGSDDSDGSVGSAGSAGSADSALPAVHALHVRAGSVPAQAESRLLVASHDSVGVDFFPLRRC